MSINAVNISRISTNLQSAALIESLRRNTLNLYTQQNQLSSGNRISTLSDDPVGGSKALRLTEILEQQDQILANIRYANNFLSATDTAVSEVHDLLTQARALASESVNTTLNQSERDANAELLKGIIDQLVTVGNRKLGGVYLFSGQSTTTAPFSQNSGGVEYNGDTKTLLSHVDSDLDSAMNITGAELFGSLSAQVTGYVDLNPTLTADTRLVDLSGTAGSGIQKGAVRVSLSSPATTFLVDLTHAETVGDVVDLMNHAAQSAGLTVGVGGQFNASINATASGLSLSLGAGSVTVAEAGDAFTARDLGLAGTAAGVLVGSDVQPGLLPETRISALLGGTGASLGSILITNGAASATLDLSGATSVQDILNKINNAGLGVKAKINSAGTGLDIVNLTSGTKLSVGEAGGNTAELLGIRSLHGGTALADLNNGQGAGINGSGKQDLHITAADGTTFDVSFEGAQTVQDVLDRINAAAASAGAAVTASLAGTGNGIQIEDSTGGGGTLLLERADLSHALDSLGLNGATRSGNTLTGTNPHPLEANSLFTALIDLHAAMVRGDTAGMTDAGDRLDTYTAQLNELHGVVGARAQAMATRQTFTEAAVDSTKALLSNVKEIDYTEAVTSFQKAQTALQANLMSASKMVQLSLLDFLT